tara:strand:+ start:390 stop:620 length:231 start_codon:yes stop_codon:yes gene_type:complete
MTALETAVKYKQMEETIPNSSMLREVKTQYAEMANGGDGGELGFEENGQTTCRGINYPDHPDSFFQEVCALLGWQW